MTTINGLLQTIKDATADLEDMLNELHQPFSGMLDTEHQEQVESERNYDHFKDEQI